MIIGDEGLENVDVKIPQGASRYFTITHKDADGNVVDHSQSTAKMAFVGKDGNIQLDECCTCDNPQRAVHAWNLLRLRHHEHHGRPRDSGHFECFWPRHVREAERELGPGLQGLQEGLGELAGGRSGSGVPIGRELLECIGLAPASAGAFFVPLLVHLWCAGWCVSGAFDSKPVFSNDGA